MKIDFRQPPRRDRKPGILVAVSGVFQCRLLDPVFARRGSRRRVVGHTLRDEWAYHNAATTAGLNYLLDAAFRAQTAVTTWYIGLIDNAGFTALAAADTMSSHAGWAEFTSYSETTRQAWTIANAAASGSLTSSATTTFTISADGTLRGLFLASSGTKSGTTGTLWATATEANTRDVTNGQSLEVLYTNTFTPVS